MMPSSDPYHCPSHLETLTWIDQLFVYKEKTLEESLEEAFFGMKSNNRYEVKDDTGKKHFVLIEVNDCCNRNFYGGSRPFTMNVFNDSNQEIIRLVRPFVCCSNNELEVQSPPGVAIGLVRQNWQVCLPKFTIENERGEPAFKIAGPFVPCTFCMDADFELVSLNGAAINTSFGKIFKPFSGCGPAGADFVLRFPRSLEVKMKATLLGACILIDCLYYENRQ
ncbi:LOW QUALITY PROTEIN: phospholipid scramblase 2 [Rhinichthys klamathensis goyatoka]|uniref:LOW QUALITY PROTEIN: phospholipid scramblase 2 n=1 Tax=Rhinichthys klamathensis goyatoka TaxID=3034132 RepID=UPI0024B5B8FB|nr:LOW QUALITY PROTEIN: phospholipid scramblase 2 [Rhinichthys klamathensis goyatoka]